MTIVVNVVSFQGLSISILCPSATLVYPIPVKIMGLATMIQWTFTDALAHLATRCYDVGTKEFSTSVLTYINSTQGRDCSTPINSCILNPCQNGGTCHLTDTNQDGFSCSCPIGFEGKKCEVNPDDCEDNDCENNSTCMDGINNYACLCLPNYT
ncbi:hypothetical protein JD844_011936, partial [Phrynosoma platyrhinos]